MKILFILPYDNLYRYRGPMKRSVNYAPITFTTLAALVPPDMDVEIEIVDEGVQKPDYEGKTYDIVGLTCVVSSAPRAYELSRYWKSKGAYLIMGGAHPTSYPDEAAAHCDSLFLGFAEQTFPKFLRDFAAKKPKRIYRHDSSKPLSSPAPLRHLQNKKLYVSVPTVVANRGCMNNCEFCSIAQNFGKKNNTRPVAEVIDEIRGLRSRTILFLDPSPTSDREYALEFFGALAPLKKKFATPLTSNIYRDPELLELLVKSGCIATFIGFESFSHESMASSRKGVNRVSDFRDCVRALHSHGIDIMGSFVLGQDGDTRESLKRVPELIDEIEIDLARLAILTPYPGTDTFARLKKEGRILTEDWSRYDSQQVVFMPRHMTPDELLASFNDAYRRTYTNARIIRRSLRAQHRLMLSVFNFGFKKIVRNLDCYDC